MIEYSNTDQVNCGMFCQEYLLFGSHLSTGVSEDNIILTAEQQNVIGQKRIL